jgi:hypothetical protein
MKHITFLFIALSAFFGATAQLVESDFSEWEGGSPVGWNGSQTNIGNDFQQVSSDVGFGEYAVRLIYTGNSNPGHRRFTTQPLTTENGVSYNITFRVRGNGDVRVGLFDDREDGFGFVYAAWSTLNSEEYTEINRTIVGANNHSASEFILSVRNTAGDLHIEVDSFVITSDVVPVVSIYDIQFTEDPSGSSPLVGETVNTGGIVSAVIPPGQNNGFFVQSGNGAWSGVFVFTNNTTVNRGDSVTFVANVVEHFNMTQLSGVAALNIVSSNNPLYAPTVISTTDVNSEPYEGVLVRVEDALCTNADSGFGQWVVNDGSGSCLINSTIYNATRAQGTSYNITGPVFYSFDEYKIMPRDMNDVEQVVSVSELSAAAGLKIWPNPTTDVLNLTGADGSPLMGHIRIVDAQGREVLQQQLGAGTGVIEISGLPAGWYTLQHFGQSSQQTVRFVKH